MLRYYLMYIIVLLVTGYLALQEVLVCDVGHAGVALLQECLV